MSPKGITPSADKSSLSCNMQHTVTLRPISLNDVDAVTHLADNPLIAANMRDAFPHPYRVEDAQRYINMVKDFKPARVMAIEVNGQYAGSAGIFPKEDVYRHTAEIGYWLGEEFWGMGIGTQAAKQIVVYAFANFNINRLVAHVFAPNVASQKVLQKAGFSYEGTLKQAVFKNGSYYDELIFAILRQP